MTKVFINGSSGTTGLRVLDRLKQQEDIELLFLPEPKRKDVAAQVALAKLADITILCLPDDASRAFIEALGDAHCKVLDTSTAFRTDPSFAYGFPELSQKHEEAIRHSTRVANTGCHAAGTIALLYPLLQAQVIAPSMPISITSITGYSGGGKKMIAEYESDHRDSTLDSPRAYAVTQQHKHLPEIVKVCNLTSEPIFQPIVADYYNGMLVSIPLHPSLMLSPLEVSGLTAVYRSHYENQPMIHVLDPNSEPLIAANAMADSDQMQIIVTGNVDRIIVTARFDNLGKGACGMAIQNMNLMIEQ